MIDVGDLFDNLRWVASGTRGYLRNRVELSERRVLLVHGRKVLRYDHVGTTKLHDLAMIKPHGAVAQLFHVAGGVRHEENRHAA